MKNMGKFVKTKEEWEKILTPKQFDILRRRGTESAFSSELLEEKRDGTYSCVACGNEVFSSETKFDSGTGWPSFTKPKNDNSIKTKQDNSLALSRTEVLCKTCGSHLGHVFEDGPKEKGGKRYCINGIALNLKHET